MFRLRLVLLMPEPRDEDCLILTVAPLSDLPLGVEHIADAVGRALEDDLGSWSIGDSLADTPACFCALGQNATSDPWKYWIVSERPISADPAVATL